MSKQDELGVAWSTTLVAAALGCGPGQPPSLEAGVDESGGDEGASGGDGDPDGGGGGSDGIAPELISARTDETGKYVLLRFSEPMAPPTGVDPSDFRISRAMAISWHDGYDGYTFSYSNYYDLVFTSSYYTYPYSPFLITSVTAGGVVTDLILEFDQPLTAYTCDVLHEVQANIEETEQYDPTFEGRVELFPHYSPGEIPVRSAQGEPLAAIGPEWVELDNFYMEVEEFGFPNLSPQIPIDCIIGG